jgi:hypothetical protein
MLQRDEHLSLCRGSHSCVVEDQGVLGCDMAGSAFILKGQVVTEVWTFEDGDTVFL